jgi:NAD(P)-dependent dehydrogenase (short-subunit alcohol dehydrogenase family)
MTNAGQTRRHAVVTGATGAVGSGIVHALLQAGWQVHAVGRDQAKLKQLTENTRIPSPEQLHCHMQTAFDAQAMAQVRSNVLAISPSLQLVVASLGGWMQGPRLVEMDTAHWQEAMQNNLQSHWLCAKQWLPALAQNASAAYVLINGGAALAPVPGAGAVSVAAGAQITLKNALARESYPNGPRVYTVLANTPVITQTRPHGPSTWLGTDDIAHGCIACFEDSAATHHGKTLVLGEKAPGKPHTPTSSWQ